MKVGDYTNQGYILFIDDISERVPDPLCKVSKTGLLSHRLSELRPMDAPIEQKVTLFDKVQMAIANPKRQTPRPYARTSDGKYNLNMWVIDAYIATKSVFNLLYKEKILK